MKRILLIDGNSFVFEMVPEGEQPRYADMPKEEVGMLLDFGQKGGEPMKLCERALEKIIVRLREAGAVVEDMG